MLHQSLKPMFKIFFSGVEIWSAFQNVIRLKADVCGNKSVFLRLQKQSLRQSNIFKSGMY